MVLQAGVSKRKVLCCKLPLSTGPKPVNCGQPKLLLAVYDCHLESRGRLNPSEQHGINARNSLKITVSDHSHAKRMPRYAKASAKNWEDPRGTCLSSSERFCGAFATAMSERSVS
jgi:hypothetical protein